MKVMNTKKGQAALEFLSTYGFAFLIILVMIGALAYFGVLNPTNLLPGKCTGSQELSCQEWLLDREGPNTLNISLVLKNNVGDAVQIKDVIVRDLQGNTYNTSTGVTCPSMVFMSTTWNAGTQNQLSCDVTVSATLPPEGQRQTYFVDVVYKGVSKTFYKTAEFEVQDKLV